jgi:hypothetical protein
VSKRREEQGDWRSSPDAFLRSVRADHEASASDFARVQAQLARRLAASGAEAPVRNVEKPAIGPKATFAKVSVAKLAIGLTLLAAGSFGVVRTLDFVHGRAPRPERTMQKPLVPAPAAGPLIHSAPEVTASTQAPAQDSPPPVGAARREASARVPQPRAAAAPRRPGTSASSASNLAKEPSALPAAALRPPASTEPGAAAQIPSGSSALAQTSARLAPQPRAAGTLGSQPRAAGTLGSQPRAAGTLGSQPKVAATLAPRPRAAATLETKPAQSEASTGPTPARPQARKPRISAEGRAELGVVERMQAAMRAGKPAAALALSAEHAKRWPAGIFSEEREAVSAIASCTLRTDDAVLRARRFLREHPHAPTAPRVAAACALPGTR